MAHLFSLLCLSSVPRLGPVRMRSLVSAFGSPEAVLRSTPERLCRVSGIELDLALLISRHRGDSFAREQLLRVRKHGARIVTFWDPEYPELLKALHDPPLLLYVQGTRPEGAHLALVGTRQPSPYGKSVAEYLGRELANRGITIVSGLARGIDTIAHRVALSSGGATVAVIGSGLDVPYPPENKILMHEIARTGAVVSEFPMGTRPAPAHFPRRNRIISGLSLGCVVVESDTNGGAMITASCALDQNREVFAVPGNITERTSAGPNALIRDGRAKLVHSIEDVLSEFRMAETIGK